MSPPRPEDPQGDGGASATVQAVGLKSGVGTPPSIASNRDFGLGGVSVSSVSKHKKLGPPEFQSLISRFTEDDVLAGKLVNPSSWLRRLVVEAPKVK